LHSAFARPGRAVSGVFGRLIVALILQAPARSADPSAGKISFHNDVMVVLSKAGCNAGQCHGNANGKAGFKLSLRGEDPEWDYNALTRDMFGRRTNPEDPDQSLVLLKPLTTLAHEGGQRFKIDSLECQILRDWIADGMPPDPPGAPTLERLEVSPAERILFEPIQDIQLHAVAVFSDGSSRDVTRMAAYDTANGLVKVTHDGLVQRQTTGETTVLVRYLHAQIPVRLAFMPARAGFVWEDPPANNYIDEHIFAKLRALRIHPADACTDNEFIRRAFLDLLGILPTAEEAKSFVNEDAAPLSPSLSPSDGERVAARPGEGKSMRRLILQNPKSEIRNPKLASASSRRRLQKRARLIDRLLERPEFADFWALKWADLLRAEERLLDRKGIEAFHRWIRQSIAENKPLDRFARELIAARGSTYFNPAANFYRAIREPVGRAHPRGMRDEALSIIVCGSSAATNVVPYLTWLRQEVDLPVRILLTHSAERFVSAQVMAWYADEVHTSADPAHASG